MESVFSCGDEFSPGSNEKVVQDGLEFSFSYKVPWF